MFEIKDKKIWLILFFYGLASVLYHFAFLEVGGGDDLYFMTCLEGRTLGEFLIKRWNGWSSRLIIETVVVTVLRQPVWVWKIMDIFVSILVAYLVFGMLFHKKEGGRAALFCGVLLILYDFREMSSAGWMTTTIFYWWVLAAAMLAFCPVYFHYRKEPVRPWLYVLAVPLAFFAANQEQMAIIFVCFSIYMIGVYCYEQRKIPKFLFFLLAVGLICLLAVLLSPGNEVRKIANIDYWFPGYAGFDLIQKGLLGWYGLLRTLFKDMNWLFFAFCVILFRAVMKKGATWYEKLISAVPVCANAALLACLIAARFRDAGPVNKVVHAFDFDQPIVYYQGSLPMKLRLLMLAYTLVCLCVVVSMFVLWGATERFCHMLAILAIGSASKISMGMSPTVWASSERTSLFLLFAFLFLGGCCAEDGNL